LRTFFKKFLFKIINSLFRVFKNKSHLDLVSVSDIVILIQKPLGIGDLIMLSPLILLLEVKFTQHNIYVVTEYEKFINFERAIWIHPGSINKVLFKKKSLVISPMLTFSHFKYLYKSYYFIGYFFSNKLVSNFMKNDYKYELKNDHYLKKIFPILDALNIRYNKQEFIYPKINKTDENNYSNNILIAPYVNWEERQLPQSNLVALINQLLELSTYKIILVGSSNSMEVQYNKQIEALVANSRVENQTGLTSLMDISKLINNTKLFIGNDSGPSHIAYLCARKSLVFFGSVRFEDRIPLNSKLEKNITCVDSRERCDFFPCYDGLSKPNCVNKDKFSCISYAEISNEKIKEFLN
jgi:ADP-heptose:LPS heptosyltransferase